MIIALLIKTIIIASDTTEWQQPIENKADKEIFYIFQLLLEIYNENCVKLKLITFAYS